MTGPAPTITVRELLVEAILWWLEGGRCWPDAGPGRALQTLPPADQNALYDLVAAAERETGQTYLEWLMEHLAHHGAGYLTADGQIVEANRPDGSPAIPVSLLEAARGLYAKAVQPG